MTAKREETGMIGARLLAAGGRGVSPEELAAEWFCQRAEMRLPGLAALADAPDLLPRVRGALGRRLMRSASVEALAGGPCPWRPPCALEVFFGARPRVKMGRHMVELPAPLALTADAADDGALLIGMHIFGFACDWAQVMMEALAAALRRGVRWGEVMRGFTPPGRVEIESARLRTLGAPMPEHVPEAATIALLTGLDTQTADVLERPESLFSRLAARISGLARWHDCALEADWGRLAEVWRGLDYEVMEAEGEEMARRRSSRQRRGYVTAQRRLVLRVRGELAPLLPFLAMGETAHAGRKAALGLGRIAWVGEGSENEADDNDAYGQRDQYS